MNELTPFFWEQIFLKNMILMSFWGCLLLLVEGQGAKESLIKGARFALCIALAGLLNGIIHAVFVPSDYGTSFWILFLASLVAIQILHTWGELEGEWMGMPRFVLALGPMLGLHICIFQNMNTYTEVLIQILGASTGFMITFILVASLREQLELAEIPEILKGYPSLLLSMGILSLTLLGFRFL